MITLHQKDNMGIEVGQMIVKSSVVQQESAQQPLSEAMQEELQKAILAECKKLIVSTVREMKER